MNYRSKKSNIIVAIILFIIAAAFLCYGIYMIGYSLDYIETYEKISTIASEDALQYVISSSGSYIGFAVLIFACGFIILSLRKQGSPQVYYFEDDIYEGEDEYEERPEESSAGTESDPTDAQESAEAPEAPEEASASEPSAEAADEPAADEAKAADAADTADEPAADKPAEAADTADAPAANEADTAADEIPADDQQPEEASDGSSNDTDDTGKNGDAVDDNTSEPLNTESEPEVNNEPQTDSKQKEPQTDQQKPKTSNQDPQASGKSDAGSINDEKSAPVKSTAARPQNPGVPYREVVIPTPKQETTNADIGSASSAKTEKWVRAFFEQQ